VLWLGDVVLPFSEDCLGTDLTQDNSVLFWAGKVLRRPFVLVRAEETLRWLGVFGLFKIGVEALAVLAEAGVDA
jgi:hypothetical protein